MKLTTTFKKRDIICTGLITLGLIVAWITISNGSTHDFLLIMLSGATGICGTFFFIFLLTFIFYKIKGE